MPRAIKPEGKIQKMEIKIRKIKTQFLLLEKELKALKKITQQLAAQEKKGTKNKPAKKPMKKGKGVKKTIKK